jgi:hypothetical protein
MATAIALRPALLATALILAGCHASVHNDQGGGDASITIGNAGGDDGSTAGNGQQSVSIKVPGFSAKMSMPNLDLGHDTKIGNMPMFPGTKVTSVNISADHADGSGGDSQGNVNMAFSAPGKAADIVSWYKDQASKDGWSAQPPSGANQFEATKQEADHNGPTHFALQVADSNQGSTGHFLVSGQ